MSKAHLLKAAVDPSALQSKIEKKKLNTKKKHKTSTKGKEGFECHGELQAKE